MVCQNKNRKHCLMYDEHFFVCTGLKDTSGSKHCAFFKDKRKMWADDIKAYKAGCRNGFNDKEKVISAYSVNGNHRKGLVKELW